MRNFPPLAFLLILLKLTPSGLYASGQGKHPQTLDANSEAVSTKKRKIAPENALVLSEVLGQLEPCHLISFMARLSKDEWCLLRLTSKGLCRVVDLVFFSPVYDPASSVEAFSSQVSPGTIGSNILELLQKAQRKILIASDKCTNEEFLDDLLDLKQQRNFDVQFITGEDRRTKDLLKNSKYSVFSHHSILGNPDKSGKMHNKFIVIDDAVVLTGSPNMTYAAYNYNVESFVAITHRFVAKAYLRYADYITRGKDKYDKTQDAYKRVAKMLEIFNNAPNNTIKLAFAPMVNIGSFVAQELKQKNLIKIDMFLVSQAQTKPDVIDTLGEACAKGAKICLKIDGAQYQSQTFMKDAVDFLRHKSVQDIYTVSKDKKKKKTRTGEITTNPQFHDKLILLEGANGKRSVCIGSAGFTTNVQDNLNLENMVLINGYAEIYDNFFKHFQDIKDGNKDLHLTKIQ